MKVFIDTSALLAVLDQDEDNYRRTAQAWGEILQSSRELVTSNYILVETLALLQHRLGLEAVRCFQEEILPALEIIWVDATVHHAATSAMLAAERRKLSLVDCVSFEVMRLAGIGTALTLDRHFHQQGFTCLPA